MKTLKNIFLIAAAISLVGCSTFGDSYTCGAIPEAGCTPVSEVYEGTNGDVYDYRAEMGNEDDKADKSDIGVTIEVSTSRRMLDYVDPGDPILTKPVLLRVLYRSFENDEKDLDAGGYSYLRMKDSEWVIQK